MYILLIFNVRDESHLLKLKGAQEHLVVFFLFLVNNSIWWSFINDVLRSPQAPAVAARSNAVSREDFISTKLHIAKRERMGNRHSNLRPEPEGLVEIFLH